MPEPADEACPLLTKPGHALIVRLPIRGDCEICNPNLEPRPATAEWDLIDPHCESHSHSVCTKHVPREEA